MLRAANWIVNGYIKDGKLITERKKVIIEMVRKGLAIAECDSCDFKSHNFKEITKHAEGFNEHKIGFAET